MTDRAADVRARLARVKDHLQRDGLFALTSDQLDQLTETPEEITVTDPFPASRLIERAAAAGYRLTPAGRQALARPCPEEITGIEHLLDQGALFDQIAIGDEDGELYFEETP